MLSVALLATLAIVPSARAVEHRWDTQDGLPQTSVTSIAQGSDGLLQVGTFGGLARFDGTTFDVWSSSIPDGWSSIRITALEMTESDVLWVGLQDGSVVRIAPDGTEQILPDSPVAGGPVWELEADGDRLWVASGQGVARWEGTWTAVPDTLEASAVLQTDQGAWIGGTFGLLRCNPDCEPVQVDGVTEARMLVAEPDALLVAGPHGLVRLCGDGVEWLEDEPVEHLTRGPGGELWYAQGSTVHDHTNDLALDLDTPIRRLFVDLESNLWVGSDSDGLIRVVREDWSLLPIEEGILPMIERPDGSVWVGRGCGKGGLVALPSGESIDIVLGCVRALATDTDGTLWIGVDDDVWSWDSLHGPTRQATLGQRVLALLPDGEGLWVGTDGGGAFFVHGGVVTPVDVLDDRVLAIEKGRGGGIWFGTHGGVSRLTDSGLVERWTRADGAPTGAIRAIEVLDGESTVLFGSYGGGLGVYRDGVMMRLTSEHGLRDNVVSSIVLDEEGGIWLNGNRGVSNVSRRDLEAWLGDPEQHLQARRWSTPEGNGGGSPAGIRTRDGALLFATVDGAVVLDPRSVFDNQVAPKVVLRRATVDGVTLEPGVVTRVPAGPGRVEIAFTAGALRHPELAQFQFRRITDDEPEGEWEPLGDDRHLVWPRLEPGMHRVEVRVANEDREWSEPLALQFDLEPAWHQRPLAWVGIGLGLLLVGFATHRWRTRDVERQNLALVREIEQREEAEGALRVSEAHYRGVFDGGSDALFVLDTDRAVRETNRAADQMFGRSTVGASFDTLIGSESGQHGARPVIDAPTETWVALREQPFEGEGTLARAVDVTDRVAAEAERRALSRRLAAAERMEAVGRLAGGIAHDFNNLLTALGGGVELLSRQVSVADQDLIEGLGACVDRGAKLTRQLLSFARRQHLEPERIEPAKLINGVEAILRPSLRDDVTLRVEHSPRRVGIDVDGSQLELALINLVLNAQDAMPGGGRITIRIREDSEESAEVRWPGRLPSRPDGWVAIEVEDNGRGIPADELEKVLEPFYTTRPDGSGLGLPSVVGFAEQSGGTLCLASRPERGTVASIVLPWVQPPDVDLVAVHSPRTDGIRGRVVVCDDDDMVREVIEAMLRRAGHDTVAFGNPLDLLAAFDDRFECDVLVTDVLMPEMTGPQLARRLLRRRPDLRVVFISGYTEDQAGRDLPGPLLAKPLRSAVLLEAVSQALERPGGMRRKGMAP